MYHNRKKTIMIFFRCERRLEKIQGVQKNAIKDFLERFDDIFQNYSKL